MSTDAEGRTTGSRLSVGYPTADELRLMLAASCGRAEHAWRLCDLHIAAGRLAAGLPVDNAWVRVQLLDLADLLAFMASS